MEFWNRNLVNLFSTPLKISEWICSLMLMGIFKILINLAFGAGVIYLVYQLNIFQLGWAFLPYVALLTMAGWFIGFLSAAIIVFYG